MFADGTAKYPPMNAGLFIYVEDADRPVKMRLIMVQPLLHN